MSENCWYLIVGNADTIVDIEWGRSSEALFKTMGFEKYRFKEYDAVAHSTSVEVITINY